MKKVIHKQVIDLKKIDTSNSVVQFEVPAEAEMVDIQWDTLDGNGIGLWYQVNADKQADILGRPNRIWRFLIVGTGDSYPETARHLNTSVRNGQAWHVLDFDGDNIEWAEA